MTQSRNHSYCTTPLVVCRYNWPQKCCSVSASNLPHPISPTRCPQAFPHHHGVSTAFFSPISSLQNLGLPPTSVTDCTLWKSLELSAMLYNQGGLVARFQKQLPFSKWSKLNEATWKMAAASESHYAAAWQSSTFCFCTALHVTPWKCSPIRKKGMNWINRWPNSHLVCFLGAKRLHLHPRHLHRSCTKASDSWKQIFCSLFWFCWCTNNLQAF